MNTPEWNEKIKALADSVRDKLLIKANPDKVAVIVEPRVTQVLPDLLTWMIYLLSPHGWTFIVYCGTLNKHLVEDFDVEIRHLGKDNLKESDYNALLLSPQFWSFMPFENVLIFQTDAVITDGRLDAFLKYDYVGAPWNKNKEWLNDNVSTFKLTSSGFLHRGHVTGNGGLSLRTRSGMLRAIHKTQYRGGNEDMFFSISNKKYLNIPPSEIAMKFAVESILCPDTKGFHAPWRYLTPYEMKWIYATLDNLTTI